MDRHCVELWVRGNRVETAKCAGEGTLDGSMLTESEGPRLDPDVEDESTKGSRSGNAGGDNGSKDDVLGKKMRLK